MSYIIYVYILGPGTRPGPVGWDPGQWGGTRASTYGIAFAPTTARVT